MPKGEMTWLRIADGDRLAAMIQEALSADGRWDDASLDHLTWMQQHYPPVPERALASDTVKEGGD